ncbi:MAG: DUF523 domain-containing protein [Rhodobacter sp.]|nr:DUF523 domain-containing protein [Rhodobacter sp.]
MTHLLISACLMGQAVRYDGQAKTLHDRLLTGWRTRGWLVPLCPEVAAGLPIPRPPAEIEPGATAADVLAGRGRVLTDAGQDVTAAFVQGARIALRVAQDRDCRLALLTDASPSCGSTLVHSGHHDGRRTPGAGLTAQLLRTHGIAVFAPHQIADLAARMPQ